VVKLFAVTTLGCVGSLALSVSPGLLEDTLFGFPFACLSVPVFAGWFVLLIVFAIRNRSRKPLPQAKRGRWGVLCIVMMLATIAMIRFHVAQIATFACCSAEFRRLAEENVHDDTVPRRIGPYWVDRYGADRSGRGVYFRTGKGSSGEPFSSRPSSTGFAFLPNGQDMIHARHILRHLYGDWYVYQALGRHRAMLHRIRLNRSDPFGIKT
jgi:hypothetical protein